MKSFSKRFAVSLTCVLAVPAISWAGSVRSTSHDGNAPTVTTAFVENTGILQQPHHVQSLNAVEAEVKPIRQTLHVARSSSVHAAVSTTITVKAGDTLWSLASRYQLSVNALANMNGLSTHAVLHIGQKLRITGSSKASTSRSSSLSGRGEGAVAGLGADAQGENIAQFAERFAGVPYRWAGTSPSGFDCSGLALYVYGHFGIHLPRTSSDMYGVGKSVSRTDLMPGMLVFFDTYGPGASHVGIYIGGGRFISAQSGGVKTASLGDSYWANHYIGARSVF